MGTLTLTRGATPRAAEPALHTGLPTYVVFLAVGDDDDLHQQCLFALLGCMGRTRRSEPRFVVVTDRPRRYAFVREHVDLLVPSVGQLVAWRGPHALFSRIKLEALAELLETRGPGHVLCLDSDVYPLRDLDDLLDEVGRGQLYMHQQEYRWSRPKGPRLRRVWRHVGGKTYAGHAVTEATWMWNAGVQGFAWHHRDVLEKELAVYDALAADGLHRLRHTTQQHAISLVMQQHGSLRSAEPWFAHYWRDKPGHMPAIRRRLATVFARGLDAPSAAAWLRDQPAPRPRRRLERLRDVLRDRVDVAP